jgi:YD repeat-containing protein
MRFLLMSLVIVIITNYGFTQSSPFYHSAVPQSPSAGAAAKSASIPVNYYTGLPQISIPFYAYSGQGSNLNFSVALNYFAGGVKVAEEPTSIGQGWNLSSGGIITRLVRGVPDDYPSLGYISNINPIPGSLSNEELLEYAKANKDGQSDIYQFNFGGIGGRFYLGKGTFSIYGTVDQKFVFVPSANLQLTTSTGPIPNSTFGGINSFVITTEDGTRYLFEDCELTKLECWSYPENPPYYGKFYASSWHLSKIIAPYNTDTISLEYETYALSNTYLLPEYSRHNVNSGYSEEEYKSPGVQITRHAKRLKKVTLPDKSIIDFIYKTKARCDIAGDYALEKIELRKNSELKKGIKLKQSYSTSNGFIDGDICEQYDYANKRMFLAKATEYTQSGDSNPYNFEYENEVFLPSFTSRSQDEYGFFNGADNSRLIPPYAAANLIGANRSSDFSFAKAGSLKKFTLPTGAYNVFDYESNKKTTIILNPQSQPFSSASVFTVNTTVFQSNKNSFVCKVGTTNGQTCPWGDCLSSVIVKLNFQGISTPLQFNGDEIKNGISKEFELPNGSYSVTATATFPPNFSANFVLNWSNESVQPETITGGLRLKKIITGNGIDPSKDISRLLNYNFQSSPNSSGYTYELPKYDYTFTQGVEKRRRKGLNWEYYWEYQPKLIRSSGPYNVLTYPQGNTIGYSRVEVTEGDEKEHVAKTVYEFTSFKDLYEASRADYQWLLTNSYNSHPYHPFDKGDFFLGLPKRTSVFDNTGKLKKKTDNYFLLWKFDYANWAGYFTGLNVALTAEHTQYSGAKILYFDKKYVAPVSGNSFLFKTVDSTYFDNGSATGTYTERTLGAYNTVRKVTTDYDLKKGQKLEQRFYYPFDYTYPYGTLLDSIDNFPFKFGYNTSPIANETWITENNNSSKLLSAGVVELKRFNNVVKPWKSYKLLSTAPVPVSAIGEFNSNQLVRNSTLIKQVSEFDLYSSKGLNVQVTNNITGQSSSQIFDKNEATLLASVTNATNSEIAFTSFETEEQGNWVWDGTIVSGVSALTGKKYFSFSNGLSSFISKPGVLPAGKNYILSFYVKNGNPAVAAPIIRQEYNPVTGWTYYEYRIAGGNSVFIQSGGIMDELRLHPEGSEMTTYTYEHLTGVSSVCNSENRIVKYEYDSFGRLKTERDVNGAIIKFYEYGTRK